MLHKAPSFLVIALVVAIIAPSLATAAPVPAGGKVSNKLSEWGKNLKESFNPTTHEESYCQKTPNYDYYTKHYLKVNGKWTGEKITYHKCQKTNRSVSAYAQTSRFQLTCSKLLRGWPTGRGRSLLSILYMKGGRHRIISQPRKQIRGRWSLQTKAIDMCFLTSISGI